MVINSSTRTGIVVYLEKYDFFRSIKELSERALDLVCLPQPKVGIIIPDQVGSNLLFHQSFCDHWAVL